MAQGLDNPAEFPLGDACPRHIQIRVLIHQKKSTCMMDICYFST